MSGCEWGILWLIVAPALAWGLGVFIGRKTSGCWRCGLKAEVCNGCAVDLGEYESALKRKGQPRG